MIKRIFEKTKDSFMSDPINNLGFLIPVFIGLISLISGIVYYIRFIIDGGYANQISATKEFGLFDGYDEKFTSGTSGMINSGVIGKIILVLVCIEFLLMMINYFRTSGKAKRIVMTITVFWIAISNLVINEEAVYEVLKPFEGMSINPKTILITYAVLTLVLLITFLTLILITKDCRWMIGYSAIALSLAYIGIPLVFLFLQNIIPLVTGAVALAIIGIVILVGFIVVLPGESEGGSSSSSSSNYGGSCRMYDNKQARKEEKLRIMKEEARRNKERAEYYRASAEVGYESARKGDGFFTTAEEKRRQAGKDLDNANWYAKQAAREEQRIAELERKLGK